MPLFDFYVMVDWSGGARRRGGRPDAIWIAYGPTAADEPAQRVSQRADANRRVPRHHGDELNESGSPSRFKGVIFGLR